MKFSNLNTLISEYKSHKIVNFRQKISFFQNYKAFHLGDMRTSYNQKINFFLKFTQSKSSMSRQDIILSNSQSNLQISRSFYDQFSSLTIQPDYFGQYEHEFSFLLSEREQWRPMLSVRDFHRLLSNLTSIRIKSSLGGYTFLKSFKVNTAKQIKSNSYI